MKTIIKVPANSYNDFTFKLYRMMVEVDRIEGNMIRHNFYNGNGDIVSTYDERKNHGLVYNYHNHSDLVGKELKF